jgi:hypothetical protein
MTKLRTIVGLIGRAVLASLPYVGTTILASIAHPALASVSGTNALPGITQGANSMEGSLIQAGGALGIGGVAWGVTHFVHRPDDWVGGVSRLGAGGVCCYVATQAQPVSQQFGAGATF